MPTYAFRPQTFDLDDASDTDNFVRMTPAERTKLNGLDVDSSYPTRASIAAATIPAGVLYISTAGYASLADGGGATWRRVDSEPAHAGKVRSVDRFTSAGVTDNSNGGWWAMDLTGKVNARQFGAAVNGSTDDTAAVQAALTAFVTTGGGTLVLGTNAGDSIKINGTVYVHAPQTTIEGNGCEVVVDNYDAPIFFLGSATDSAIKPHDVTFRDIRFRQTETLVNPPGTFWITVTGGTLTDNHLSAAIAHVHGDRLKVLNCSFNNFLYGISFYNWSDFVTPSSGLDIIGCDFDGCNFGCFVGSAVNDVRFNFNVCRNTANIIQFVNDGTPDPPHLLYITGGIKFGSRCTRVSAIGNKDLNNPGSNGSSIKFKGVDVFTIADNIMSGSTGGLELGYCSHGTISGAEIHDLVEDTTLATSQGAIRLYGCSDILIDGVNIDLTGAGTQAFSITPLAKADIIPEPAQNITNTDITIVGARVKYAATGASPLAAFYIDSAKRLQIINAVIHRAVSQDAVMFNIQDNDADHNSEDVAIINPTVIADSSDTHRHKLAFVEAGALRTRFVINPALLFNVDDRNASFISDSGTDTRFERVRGFSNVGGKSISGRTWNLTTSHQDTIESSGAAIFEIVTGNASTGSIYFGDVDATARGRIDYNHSTNAMDFATNGGIKARMNASGLDLTTGSSAIQLLIGGTVRMDLDGAVRLVSVTAANIASAAATINTTNKAATKMIWDSTNNRIMVATGSATTSTWVAADGSVTVTPA